MSNQLQLRDWQQIKQAMALKYAGTPEGGAALAESKRYGLAADRIEELAAQVAALRGLLIAARPRFGTAGSRDVDVAARQDAFDAALAIPFDTDILRRRDAKVLDDAATTFHCRSLSGMVNGERITRDEITGCLYATTMLRAMAAELAANHSLRDMTEADFIEAHGGSHDSHR